jgi:hypothetical protein
MEPGSSIWIRLFIWYYGDAPCKPKSNFWDLFIIYILSKIGKQKPQVSTHTKTDRAILQGQFQAKMVLFLVLGPFLCLINPLLVIVSQ